MAPVRPSTTPSASSPRASPLVVALEVADGEERGTRGTVDASGVMLVGRGSEAGLRLLLSRHLSRRHFSIEVRHGQAWVVDHKSANGTELNGEPVVDRALLRDGDRVTAGDTAFLVQIHTPRAEPDDSGAAAQQTLATCRRCGGRFPYERVTILLDDRGRPLQDDPTFLCRGCREAAASERSGESPGLPWFPRYRTLESLGEGSMGAVYRVQREPDGALFALKCMRPDAPMTPSDVRRFLREAAALSQLTHKNIVGFVDQGYVEDAFFFVMQYVEGVDLDLYRRQAGGRMSVERGVRLIAQVLDGLDYAHQKGFVHRDVKPANILVGVEDGEMTPKLSDFGLAKRYEESNRDPITRGAIALGTPDYMPPEQITSFSDVGPAVDIYAVGATLYHLLTGATVYEGIASKDPIRTLLESDPVPITQRGVTLPRHVADAIMHALNREPEDRFASAADFRAALRAGT